MTGAGSGGPFRRRNAAAVGARDFGPNMTPMVDIVMVILIFFMAGSTFLGSEWFLDVGMARGSEPKEAAEDRPPIELPPTRMVVRLRRAETGFGTLATGLGVQDATIQEFAARLREFENARATGNMHVVVEPTREASYQDVIRVYDLLQRSGVRQVGLAKSPGEPAAP